MALYMSQEHKMIEKIIDFKTGEVTEREMTQAEIDEIAAAVANAGTGKPDWANEAETK
jgi:hypothetical protein